VKKGIQDCPKKMDSLSLIRDNDLENNQLRNPGVQIFLMQPIKFLDKIIL